MRHLERTILQRSDLTNANMRKAKLQEANFWETVFAATDLRDVEGLDTCIHDGPSTLDLRTVMLSWPISQQFLRGCGLPQKAIDSLPSLFGKFFRDLLGFHLLRHSGSGIFGEAPR